MTPSPLAFFAVVLRPTRTLVMIAIAIVVVALALAWVNPSGYDQGVALALFAQMFAASTGYQERARRGQFDPILTGRATRFPVAVAHFAVSLAPGAAVWTVLGLIDLVARPERWPTAFTTAGLAAFFAVSILAWSATLRLARYSGGALWMLVLVGLAATRHLQDLHQIFLASTNGWFAEASRAGAALICPLFLLGDASAFDGPCLLLAAGAGVVVWAIGATTILDADVPLLDAR